MTTTTRKKTPRHILITQLVERDGLVCGLPGCEQPIRLDAPDGPMETTIEHWYPQWWCKEQNWTQDEIWALDNLKLAHKRCNAKKGERVPNEDGTLPERALSKFRFRRQKRAGRPELCGECDNGHNLFVGEICANCGCDAQRFPKSAKVRFDECDHEILWCWVCSITPDMRPPALATAVLQGESGEWD